ncbi:MAG: toxin HicA [Candidatus Methylomirabilota bacterium]|nr:toxin HicA [Candidatus Methylomirabilis sp.]NJD69461.1 toxin HicA [candidate division NC10 bacterium]PWB42939.1 MAG: toxin HicA [candidate division NC10 bacterium]
MSTIAGILEIMRHHPTGVRFADLCKVCDHYFGQARLTSGSHRVYKTPWSGDPRVNIQHHKGYAKAYQVKQVLKAIDRMEMEHGTAT